MNHYLLLIVIVVLGSSEAAAGTQNCGLVEIVSLLSGPRHGSMMKVNAKESDINCGGTRGWVCLDPDGEHMSPEESKRLYAQVLAFHLASKPFYLSIYDDKSSSACGGYPVVEDLRTFH